MCKWNYIMSIFLSINKNWTFSVQSRTIFHWNDVQREPKQCQFDIWLLVQVYIDNMACLILIHFYKETYNISSTFIYFQICGTKHSRIRSTKGFTFWNIFCLDEFYWRNSNRNIEPNSVCIDYHHREKSKWCLYIILFH